MDSFLPTNYEIPSSGGKYFKLQQNENKLRILGSPILGYELWINKKPVRRPMDKPFTQDEIEDADPNKDGTPQTVKHFWALPVYSYRDSAVMVWEITSKTILKAIKDLVADEDWSDPKEYDLVITRSGEGFETEYSIKPKKHTPLSEEAKAAWDEVKKGGFDLKALYRGGDPFTSGPEVDIEDIPF